MTYNVLMGTLNPTHSLTVRNRTKTSRITAAKTRRHGVKLFMLSFRRLHVVLVETKDKFFHTFWFDHRVTLVNLDV